LIDLKLAKVLNILISSSATDTTGDERKQNLFCDQLILFLFTFPFMCFTFREAGKKNWIRKS